MTIPGPNATVEERAERAMEFAERFVAFWDGPPEGFRNRLVAVQRLVAELVIHACVPNQGIGYPGAENNEGLLGYKGWRERGVHVLSEQIGFYHHADPIKYGTDDLDHDQEIGIGDAVDDLADIMHELEDVLRYRDEEGTLAGYESLRGGYRYHLGPHHVGSLITYIDHLLTVPSDEE